MEEQIMMNDCKDYEMNKGIRLMSATSQSKQAEDDDFSLESLILKTIPPATAPSLTMR